MASLPARLRTQLPSSPALPTELERRLEESLARATEKEPLALPRVKGLSEAAVSRWLLRGAQREAASRGEALPLVHLDLAKVAPGAVSLRRALRASAACARGGGLHLLGQEPGPTWRRAVSVAREIAEEQGAALLVCEGPPVEVPPELLGRWLDEDRLHGVDTDPDLEPLRRALELHARGEGVLLLLGPPGVGKRALTEWAALHHASGSVGRLLPGGGPPPQWRSGWLLAHDVDALSPEALERLYARLSPRPAPLARRPPDDVGPRPPGFDALVGESAALRAALRRAEKVAPRRELSVLIRGERGAGKELLAQGLHARSGAVGGIVSVDLSALAPGLVEAELFGISDKAASGVRGRTGLLERADRGTLFLDEIGNLSVDVQGKLLRFLTTRRVRAVGSRADGGQRVDVRVICATNADLEELCRRGSFRWDLYDRIADVTLTLPPLRERRGDVLLLAEHFLRDPARPAQGVLITPEAQELLLSWPWPGNVRELRSRMLEAQLDMTGPRLEARHLGGLQRVARGPTLVTRHRVDGEPPAPLPLRLTGLTLRVPPLRRRSEAARRAAVLHALGGRPVTPEALARLAAAPWHGNLRQLEAALSPLRHGQGLVDVEDLELLLPGLDDGRPAFRVLLHANHVGAQQVEGALRIFETAGLLIGRGVHSWASLERLELPASSALAKRRRCVSERLGGGSVGCLSIDHVRLLSRPHVLVEQRGGELCFSLLPDTERALFVRPLEEERLIHLCPGEAALASRGAELQLRDRHGGVALRLFIFLGEVADVALRPLVLATLEEVDEEQRRTVAATLEQRSEGLDEAMEWGRQSPDAVHWRPLELEERRLLVEAVMSWFDSEERYPSRWIRAQLRGNPEAEWLRRYLDHRHCIQSFARLLRYDEALADELREALARSERGAALAERLPSTLRKGLRAGQAASG